MDHDDRLVGRLYTRREMLALFGLSAFATLAGRVAHGAGSGASRPSGCVVRPEQTEGPYFVDERLERSDIRRDPSNGAVCEGTPLALAFDVSRLAGAGCEPLAGARVDVWHCDAGGRYSDVDDPHGSTLGQKFLRGHQVTDEHGRARFTTIYPGWYPGRAVHVHFMIRTKPVSGRHRAFVSQLYFDDALTDRVHARDPYTRGGARRLRNRDDGLYRRGGDRLMLAPRASAAGYAAAFDIALDLG